MGKPEKYFCEVPFDMPPLVKIPLTEECKLLPSQGIYAVSVESGPVHSKGMAIIYGTPEYKSEVLLNIFDDTGISYDHRITLFFHKKIHGAINLSDSRTIFRINSAKEEISELIY